jgi:hypothetical protein
LIDEDNKNPKK